MKCLTLHQPWASLIACGAKRFETRDWCHGLEVGDSLAIHAGLKCAKPSDLPVNDAVAIRQALGLHWSLLPRGVVVCTGRVVGLWRSLGWIAGHEWHLDVEGRRGTLTTLAIGRPGLHFGNYSPGRWLFELDQVRPLLNPQPAMGQRKIWQWKETQHV